MTVRISLAQCLYTLGDNGGAAGGRTVIERNVCHDVRAYMAGGYCLSQDQASSHVLFDSNVCLRTTHCASAADRTPGLHASPCPDLAAALTEGPTFDPTFDPVGIDLNYTNNIFFDGYHDAWSPPYPDGGWPATRLETPCLCRIDRCIVHVTTVGYRPAAVRNSAITSRGCRAEGAGYPRQLNPSTSFHRSATPLSAVFSFYHKAGR